MIPLKLEINNFLSYRAETTLDFQGIHLACISGANGAGKSSILDAMTWALFGRSRSKSDDDVVNRLAAAAGEAARVSFLFELEGVTYRVIRRKQVRKTMMLELQVATSEGKWKALSSSKIRETQAAIEAVLSMSYDTFTNASFLLQGKADEFTTKTANKRKEILADLLGVNEWDRYKQAAGARRSQAEDRLLLLDSQLRELDEELAERPERESRLSAAAQNLERLSERLALQEQLVEQLRRTEMAIEQQRQTVRSLDDRMKQEEKALLELKQNLNNRQQERDNHQALIDEAESITARYSDWQRAREALEAWQVKADDYHALQQAMRPYELALERERSRLNQRRSELEANARKVMAMKEERGTLAKSMNETQSRLEQSSFRLQEIGNKEAEWHEARSTLQQMEAERQLWSQEAGQLAEQAQRIGKMSHDRPDVDKNLQQAQLALNDIAAGLAVISEQQGQLAQVSGELDNRQAEQPELREKMSELETQIGQLKVETGGECPLCGQPLSDQHRSSVITRLEADGKQLGDRFRQNLNRITSLTSKAAELRDGLRRKERLEREQRSQQQRVAAAEARLEEIDQALREWEAGGAARLAELEALGADDTAVRAQHAAVTELQEATEERAKLESSLQQLRREATIGDARLAEIDRSIAQWEGLTDGQAAPEAISSPKAELAAIVEKLESGMIDREVQVELSKLEDKATKLRYEPTAHEEVKKLASKLGEAQTQYQELQRAEATVKALDDSLADLRGQAEAQQDRITTLNTQQEEALLQLKSLESGDADTRSAEKELNSLREEQIAAHRQMATAQQSVEVLKELGKQREARSNERAETTLLIQRLRLLEKACGREGVQALLIEHALPEIEDDANELLERLTGGHMSVVFDTQRKLKSSDRLAETLDIRIVDEVGERPYENFSGGEQFRVNFAIRLALSKILAKRAGARLQTLVIDEGFGSQDPIGRQRLIEAINTIQDDFERILVITHIDEMRDAFPTRIEVEKHSSGSVIEVR